MNATSKSEWKVGQAVMGNYCGIPFTGTINENTRPTPDYKNIIFSITLGTWIEVYGQIRKTIEVWTNGEDEITLIPIG